MCADWEREKKCYTVQLRLLCPDCPQLVQVLLFLELEELQFPQLVLALHPHLECF